MLYVRHRPHVYHHHGLYTIGCCARTSKFLSDGLKSYVYNEEDGDVILRMVSNLGIAIFCTLEWVMLELTFVVYVDRECVGNPLQHNAKARGEDDADTWLCPFLDLKCQQPSLTARRRWRRRN
jgi:hypothetical protein